MTTSREPAGGYHAGELAVQQRAGVAAEAARLEGMLAPAQLRRGMAGFLGQQTYAVLTARDAGGRLWVSPLTGPPGFLSALDATTLAVHARPAAGDPLHLVAAGQQVGLLAIDFAGRRRVRINGLLTGVIDATAGLAVSVREAYGNCPAYIHPRDLTSPALAPEPSAVRRGSRLSPADAAALSAADTFFVGSTHPTRGPDASHRGGEPGFVHVEGDGLWWPDYPGNTMFNTLGNFAVDPTAALLFPDFTTGATVQLSGTATVEWDDDGSRRVRFMTEEIATTR